MDGMKVTGDKESMNPVNLILMNDGSLFDIEAFGESLCEILPTIYQVDVGKERYRLSEDENDFLNHYSNATEVTIHLLAFKDEVGIEKVDV